jgi:hypothetical protein
VCGSLAQLLLRPSTGLGTAFGHDSPRGGGRAGISRGTINAAARCLTLPPAAIRAPPPAAPRCPATVAAPPRAPAALAAPPGCRPARQSWDPRRVSADRAPLPRGGLGRFHRARGTDHGRGGKGCRWRVPMPGMKITLDSAMRARDISRPRPENEAAAELLNDGATAARPRPPHPGVSRSAPVRTGAPETSRPGPPAPRMAPGAARPAATSETATASVTPSRRSAPAQPPPAAAQPRSPGTPKTPGQAKTPGQNGEAGRGRSGGRGKRHRTRKRGGR